MPLEVSLQPASAADLPTLTNLMQLYTYEFSDLLDLDLQESGLYLQRDLSGSFRDPLRHVLFIRADGKLAGFAIVDRRSRLSDAPGMVDMAEFFVLRRYKRQGIGSQAATQAFDLFRGHWEVRQIFRNTGATAFWRHIIGRYTDGRYTETIIDDARWHGPVQSFDNSAG